MRCLLLTLGLVAGRVSWAADLVVVVNPLNPTTEFSSKTVCKLYMGSIRYWDGGSVGVVTYLRPESTPAGDGLMELCHQTRARFDAMWRRRQLAGGGIRPGELGDVSAVVGAIAEDPRAITVITTEEMATVDSAAVRLVPL